MGLAADVVSMTRQRLARRKVGCGAPAAPAIDERWRGKVQLGFLPQARGGKSDGASWEGYMGKMHSHEHLPSDIAEFWGRKDGGGLP